MTLLDFFGALRRRWFVAVLGLVLTPALFGLLATKPPVYTAHQRLVFLTPHSKTNANALQQPTPVSIAAVAAMRSTGAPLRMATSNSQVPLFARGVTDGDWTSLEHSGNQWNAFAPTPYVRVEASGSSPEVVQRRIAEQADGLINAVRELEEEFGSSPSQQVTITKSPETVEVHWVPPSRSRAMLGTALLGLGSTVAAVAALDRAMGASRSRAPALTPRARGRIPQTPRPGEQQVPART